MSVVYKLAAHQEVVENILEHQLGGILVHMWVSVHLILLFFVWLLFSIYKKKIELNLVILVM